MPDPVALMARSQGCDATHRAGNLDTHLTHGCIQLFRHFLRRRSDGAYFGSFGKRGFPPSDETADRCRMGVGR